MDLLPKQASFNNELTKPASSDIPFNTDANNESRDFSTPCSDTKENMMPIRLCRSSLDNYCYNKEDMNLYIGKRIFLNSQEILKVTSENKASKRKTRTSESEDSLSSIEDVFSGILCPDKMFIDYKQIDGPLASETPRSDETEFLLSDNSLQPALFINMSCNDREDTASRESATPSSVFDDESSMSDYYDDDEDKERFCQQEEIITKRMKLEAESLKVEDSNSISSYTFRDEACETPTSKIAFIEVETTENAFVCSETSSADTQPRGSLDERDLLIQVQKFFSENPITDKTTCGNQVLASKYFTDEFLQQHGLTVDEKEVVSVEMELEDNTVPEMESQKSYSYLRRLGKLLERRPLSILMTLFEFYLEGRVSTDNLVQRVDQAIRGNRRFTISGMSDLFPKTSRSSLHH
ncbi:unnamed protein product [Larinioides sclopetarius]|uniref:Uncharacterized protein n=1 Tax=Larinioides sclopetarius TaxID=280406 RepID=A0AAV2B2U0_9ARAC